MRSALRCGECASFRLVSRPGNATRMRRPLSTTVALGARGDHGRVCVGDRLHYREAKPDAVGLSG